MAFQSTASFERVNPATAREWLKQNTRNRKLRPLTVTKWVRLFENGEYIPTCEGIGFDSGGVLVDGQHRLEALSQMPEEFSIYIVVARNLTGVAYKAINDGARRSSQDRFHTDRCTAQVGEFLAYKYYTNRLDITNGKKELFVNFAKPYCDALMFATSSATKTFSSTPVRAAALLSMAMGIPKDYVCSLYKALVLADYDAMPNIGKVFTRQAQLGTVHTGDASELFLKALKVFNPANAQSKQIRSADPVETAADIRTLLKSRVVGI